MTLERIEHKVFASEAPLDEMGQFGSALATTKLNTKDVAEIQALPAYTKGWGSAIISESNYPAMEEMNGVLNVMSYHTGYLYQEGIPTYSATQEYSVTSWVKDLAGEKVYKSLQGGNKGHDLTDSSWWEELKLGGGGLEIGDIGIAPLGIDETKGKRRYLNGQLIIQDQYVQFTNKVKSAIALYPTLACTESEWQTAVTMSVFGSCGKFVVDNTAGTIRLPKINGFIQGLTNLSSLANIVNAGLPNITGGLGYIGGSQWESPTPTGVFNGTVGANMGFANGGSGNWVNNVTFDASRSSAIYGKSNTVQPEAVKYPYFIQVATGAEVEDNIINEIELNNPFSLLDYKYSEYELNNLSWLRSNGQWNSKAVYPAVYELLLKIYNGTETKAGVSVKLSTDTSATDYDFRINTAEETFMLPIKVKQTYYNNTSIPVIIDKPYIPADGSTATGFVWNQVSTNTLRITNNSGNLIEDNVKLSGVADLSSIEISNDLYLYFYVGETVQNANLVNVGRIEEKIASLIPDNSSLISGYAMPSDKYIDLTLGASNSTYTAPANGYFYVNIKSTGTQKLTYVNIINNNSNINTRDANYHPNTSAVYTVSCICPAKKGDIVIVSYDVAITIQYSRLSFVYAEGEV